MENKSSGTLVINGNSGPLTTIAKAKSDLPKVNVITTNAVPVNINNADVVNNNSNNVRNEANNRTSTSTATSTTSTTTTNTTVVSNTNSTVNVNNVPIVESESESEARLTVFFALMRKESERLLTFVEGKWPISFISKESLANAGFFYLMNGDRVQCAFCQGVVCYWEPDDVPLVEHRHHFARCPFLMGYEVGNIPIDKDPIRGDKRLGRDVCGGFHRTAATPSEGSLLKTYSVPPITVNLEDFGVLVHKGAKNSKYASRDYRTASFAGKWPKECKYTPLELAEAGFFYCGVSDCVKCFYCDVGICEWNKLRTPWIEHAIRSPDCGYLILNKGLPFIVSSNKNYSEELLKTSTLTETTLAEKAVNEWMESQVVKDLLSINNYPKDALHAVLQQKWEKDHINYEHLGELNSAIVSYLAKSRNEDQSSSSQESVSSEPPESLSSLESCSSSPISSSPPSTSSSPPPTFDKERLLCKMCWDREIGVVFLPCGHVACTQCAPGVTSCPVCRAVIKGTVRTFLA